MNTLFIPILLLVPTQNLYNNQSDLYSDWLDSIIPTEIVEQKPQAVVVEKIDRVAAPVYSNSQQQLLSYTLSYNPKLTSHSYLMSSAQRVADYHASTGRWGHSARSSRPGASENIAWNSQQSIPKISSQWKSSRGHNSNWLGNWNYTGVGVAYGNGRIYAVQHFANNPSNNGTTLSLQSANNRTYRVATSKRRWFRRR